MASTAMKRPTYSSWSVTNRLVGLATVTCGGGGGALAARGCPGSQPASPKAKGKSAAVTPNSLSDVDLIVRMSLGNGMVRRRNMVSFQRYSRRARGDVNSLGQCRCGRCRAGAEPVAAVGGGREDELIATLRCWHFQMTHRPLGADRPPIPGRV